MLWSVFGGGLIWLRLHQHVLAAQKLNEVWRIIQNRSPWKNTDQAFLTYDKVKNEGRLLGDDFQK